MSKGRIKIGGKANHCDLDTLANSTERKERISKKILRTPAANWFSMSSVSTGETFATRAFVQWCANNGQQFAFDTPCIPVGIVACEMVGSQ